MKLVDNGVEYEERIYEPGLNIMLSQSKSRLIIFFGCII